LHSNINTRGDSYGGSPQARCKFPLELIRAVATEIHASNVGVRLEPAGLYNGTFGAERIETWSYLCEQLAQLTTREEKLSYIHFIEPRMDRVEANKTVFFDSWKLPEVTYEPFRLIFKQTGIPCITCGGWNAVNAQSAVEQWDAVAFAKLFVSNPDLPERIKSGKPLEEYDRSRFYGSWDGVRENGYTTYPTWDEKQASASSA
jgi:2,4-dienoyl-CoA reductase-like NADH-dependent reductase (Old Yellow Enzyme family)